MEGETIVPLTPESFMDKVKKYYGERYLAIHLDPKGVPSVLFHGLDKAGLLTRELNAGVLNEGGRRLTVTADSPFGTMSYGVKTRHMSATYLFALFPHEQTDLNLYAQVQGPSTAGREIITAQQFDLQKNALILKVLSVTDLERLIMDKIKNGEIKTRADLLKVLNLDEEAESRIRDEMLQELSRFL